MIFLHFDHNISYQSCGATEPSQSDLNGSSVMVSVTYSDVQANGNARNYSKENHTQCF